MKLTNKYCEDLFNKIRNRFEKISMIDENGRITLLSRDARIFNMLFMPKNKDSMVTLSLMEPDDLRVYFNRNITGQLSDTDKKRWFEFVQDLRAFTVPRQLGFSLVDIDNAGLSVTDVKSMIQAKQEKENVTESKFGRLDGTSRSSYQMLERVRIKIKHGSKINDDIHGARSRNIRAIFIENDQGERFRFPFVNLLGARAMARHIEEGGSWTDHIGHKILETANSLDVIKKFVREARRSRACDNKTVPLLKMLKEKQDNYRRDLFLMNGSRGYQSYTSNLAETYIEPVNDIASYFTTLPESIVPMVPQIERILGEKVIDSAVDKSIAECVNWINGQNLLEAPQNPSNPRQQTTAPQQPSTKPTNKPAPKPEPKPAKAEPQGPKLARVKEKRTVLTPSLLKSMGINNVDVLAGKIPRQLVKQFQYELRQNKLSPPIVIQTQNGAFRFNSTEEQYKLWWLAANFPPEANKIEIVVRRVTDQSELGRRADDEPEDKGPIGKVRTDLRSYGEKYRERIGKVHDVLDVLADPIGALGTKIQGKYL